MEEGDSNEGGNGNQSHSHTNDTSWSLRDADSRNAASCWNCGRLKHTFRNCRVRLIKFCFRCGMPGVTRLFVVSVRETHDGVGIRRPFLTSFFIGPSIVNRRIEPENNLKLLRTTREYFFELSRIGLK
ncbi:hypothetical protein JTB14_017143 [Gonioctena quinquepunctata]|nr:hypothetical protein JTB14_017143 [Gonioctena quinquepunctata]